MPYYFNGRYYEVDYSHRYSLLADFVNGEVWGTSMHALEVSSKKIVDVNVEVLNEAIHNRVEEFTPDNLECVRLFYVVRGEGGYFRGMYDESYATEIFAIRPTQSSRLWRVSPFSSHAHVPVHGRIIDVLRLVFRAMVAHPIDELRSVAALALLDGRLPWR